MECVAVAIKDGEGVEYADEGCFIAVNGGFHIVGDEADQINICLAKACLDLWACQQEMMNEDAKIPLQ